jgi:hypothetical protein
MEARGMAQVKVTFSECVQDSQDYGSDDQHMVSRVWVEIEVDGQERGNYIVDLKQTVGADYDTGEIEVGFPHFGPDLYRGAFNHHVFADAAPA